MKLRGRELEVMTVLWDSQSPHGLTLGGVRARLGADLALTTVDTMLKRLVGKRLVVRRRIGGRWHYEAAVGRGVDQFEALKALVRERFGGDVDAVRRMLGLLRHAAALALCAVSLHGQAVFVEHLRLPALEEVDYATWHPEPLESSCDPRPAEGWLRVEMTFDAGGALTVDAREVAEPAIDWLGCPAAWPALEPCGGEGETVALCEALGGQS